MLSFVFSVVGVTLAVGIPLVPRICLATAPCGGIANIPCKDGYVCFRAPNDPCVANGGADCPACCIADPCATVRCAAGSCTVSNVGEPLCTPVDTCDKVRCL
ncbi:hypothetical protein DIPPA_61027, partial [Diplonema papillatum]